MTAILSEQANPSNSTRGTWANGLVKSTVSIFAAEFGDKTFFINCILAMTNNIYVLLLAVTLAVLLMNILSCLLGMILPLFLSRKVTLVIAGILFAIMGVVMIVKACRDDDDEEEEAREDIAAKGKKCKWLYSGIFLQAFALNFFAEWGDTSQITTILLAGNYPMGSVFVGSSVGNLLCSFLAILGGRLIMGCLQLSTIEILGGIVFIVFAVHTFFFEVPNA